MRLIENDNFTKKLVNRLNESEDTNALCDKFIDEFNSLNLKHSLNTAYNNFLTCNKSKNNKNNEYKIDLIYNDGKNNIHFYIIPLSSSKYKLDVKADDKNKYIKTWQYDGTTSEGPKVNELADIVDTPKNIIVKLLNAFDGEDDLATVYNVKTNDKDIKAYVQIGIPESKVKDILAKKLKSEDIEIENTRMTVPSLIDVQKKQSISNDGDIIITDNEID